MIFGRPGGGKSTFALKLHKKTGIPLYHLDRYFFVKNWVERDYHEFLKIQKEIVDTNCWIADGNNTKSLDMRYSRATLVLYFNYPRWLCYYRIFERLLAKDPAIKDRAENCPETVRWILLKYMWNFEQRLADTIKQLQTEHPKTKFIEIRSDADLLQLDSD